jgi:type IV secretion system protein TrbC
MTQQQMRHSHQRLTGFALLAAAQLSAGTAFAAGSGMPWEGPLEQILTSLSGPVARVVGVAAIIITGLGIAFGEGGGGMRKMLWVVFGLTIAFSATTFFLSFFGGVQGAAF